MNGIPGLTTEEVPYEILVRFDPGGAFQGAHVQNREVKSFGGHVLQETILPAIPLEGNVLKAMVAALELPEPEPEALTSPEATEAPETKT